jgi:hypothetical protein
LEGLRTVQTPGSTKECVVRMSPLGRTTILSRYPPAGNVETDRHSGLNRFADVKDCAESASPRNLRENMTVFQGVLLEIGRKPVYLEFDLDWDNLPLYSAS